MQQTFETRVRALAARAGLANLSPRTAVVAVIALLLAAGFAVWRWMPSGSENGVLEPLGAASTRAHEASRGAGVLTSSEASSESSAGGIWVHVVGSVRHPGLYGLPVGSRVQDAVKAAGGLLGNAAPAAVNLARKVGDGEQVVIPTQDEVAGGRAAVGGVAASTAAAPGAGGSGATGPVDLNAATAEQLDVLPGIGPATAAKIVAERDTNGPFGSIEDLGRVSGIGAKKLEQLKDLICVR